MFLNIIRPETFFKFIKFYNLKISLKTKMSKQFGNIGTWNDFYTDHFADLTEEFPL